MSKDPEVKKFFSPDLSLTPDQQDLLRTALSSNTPPTTVNMNQNSSVRASNMTKPNAARSSNSPKQAPPISDSILNKSQTHKSPLQASPGSAILGGFDESPLLESEYDDANFDWDNSGGDLFGSLPGNFDGDDGDLHDKRKNPEDEEDEEENGTKRQEGEDKTAKKPGRKPLTGGEPTTKRKAQNRAAQRAFRERKERHLKELETKVDDLEKTSETTNHENGRLRAEVNRLNTELKEYRKRLSMNGTGGGRTPPSAGAYSSQSRNFYNNPTEFQFAFPKFGDLPSFMSSGSISKSDSTSSTGQRASPQSVPGVVRASSYGSVGANSPTSLNGPYNLGSNNDYGIYQSPTNSVSGIDGLNGLFSPSILETARRSNSTDYMGFDTTTAVSFPEKQGSTNSQSSISITTSPSASSVSNNGLDSSCGTTPEPAADSPDNRKGSEGTLNTINEESVDPNKLDALSSFVKSPISDINGIDWMAQQNGGQFDPVLFGDYRDPQENILNSNAFSGEFFNDAFLSQDLGSPYNTTDMTSPPTNQNSKQDADNTPHLEKTKLSPADPTKKLIDCDNLWHQVYSLDKAKTGDFDENALCAQFRQKAKCSGGAMPKPVIEQKDADDIIKMFT